MDNEHERRKCPGGGIGRRVGLKHQWPQGRAGSTPALGTIPCSSKGFFYEEALLMSSTGNVKCEGSINWLSSILISRMINSVAFIPITWPG